jgi:hypothetical protein
LERWCSLPAAWIGIALYAVLAGASAGIVRAAVMSELCVFTLLSVAAADAEGLWCSETMSALNRITVLRNDMHGWICLSTYGQRMWAKEERGK